MTKFILKIKMFSILLLLSFTKCKSWRNKLYPHVIGHNWLYKLFSYGGWFPKNVSFDVSIFSDKPNSTSMIAKQGTINITLLKNGKLLAQIDGQSGYKNTAPARYKCDMGANGVKLALNNTSPRNSISEESNKVSSTAKPEQYFWLNCKNDIKRINGYEPELVTSWVLEEPAFVLTDDYVFSNFGTLKINNFNNGIVDYSANEPWGQKGTKINFKYDAEENTLLTNVFDEYADITNVNGSCDIQPMSYPFNLWEGWFLGSDPVIIQSVVPGLSANLSGLREGDKIKSINSIPTKTYDEFVNYSWLFNKQRDY